MADTGAPWELPYPLPTDLVKDGAAAIQALAEATADGLDAAGNAGIGSNVVQTVKTDVFSTSADGVSNVTGMSVTITPTSTTSRLLVVVSVLFASTTGTGHLTAGLRLSDGTNTSPVATDVGSRLATTVGHQRGNDEYYSFSWLYTPGVTSAVTINLQILRQETLSTSFVNRRVTDTDNAQFARTTSTITAIEVAA